MAQVVSPNQDENSPETTPPSEELQTTPSSSDTSSTNKLLQPIKNYLRDSRNLLNSLILVVPLFVIYQIGILSTDGVQNGVDFVTPKLLALFNGNKISYVLFNFFILALMGLGVWFLRKRQQFSPKLFGFLILEGTAYGLLLGTTISSVLQKAGLMALQSNAAAATEPQLGPVDNFVLSLGAGLYEELVFRLILLGGSVWLITSVVRFRTALTARSAGQWTQGQELSTPKVFWNTLVSAPGVPDLDRWSKVGIALGAIFFTSILFSAVHYVGGLADDFTLYSFLFRFLAGIFFAVLYYVRGFAVAVYTHAIYDVMVLVF